MFKFWIILFCLIETLSLCAQDTVVVDKQIITLSEVVIDSRISIPAFVHRIKNDSSFYKAFKNLRILGYDAINDIRMMDKKGELVASLFSKTKQQRKDGCRTMSIIEEHATGDMYDKSGQFNYYTASMYASLFFTKGKICGESNIVAGHEITAAGKSGMEKHKEQLKMLFFNPGRKIKGIPFLSSKTEIFGEDMAAAYNMSIDMDVYNGIGCYIFTQKVKPGYESDVVIDEMTTWFNEKTFEVVARNYALSYDAAVYDFNVQMEVVMAQFEGLTVPSVIRYNGNWKAITKKRERGVFTATLSNFCNNN